MHPQRDDIKAKLNLITFKLIEEEKITSTRRKQGKKGKKEKKRKEKVGDIDQVGKVITLCK